MSTKMETVPPEFARLKRSGDEHYDKKEYAIAVECYRAALQIAPGDRTLLFNLAYSLAFTKDDAGAALVYQQAIEAGSGSAAHNNLGLCYRRLGKNKEARDEFVKATRLDGSDPLYWRNLAVSFADLKDPKAELTALERLSRRNGCKAADWNNLGRAREQDNDIDAALAAFRKAAASTPQERAYFFNIGLMHERSGRLLDAYHACRHSLMIGDGYQSAATMLARLDASLVRSVTPPPSTSGVEYKFHCPYCGQRISADRAFAQRNVSCPSCRKVFIGPVVLKKPRDIGPHDYINPYTLLNLPEVSGDLRGDEWHNQPANWVELVGSLTRRRRALAAEFQLNDGRVSWLPQLNVAEEIIHRVLSDLDDQGWHGYHWIVFRLPLLNRFLMDGDLEYFHSLEYCPYPLAAELDGQILEDKVQRNLLDFISPYFLHRWAKAIKESLEADDYVTAGRLQSTALPLVSVDLDEAYEPVRRHFSRRREVLKAIEKEVVKTKKGSKCVQSHRATEESSFLKTAPRHIRSSIIDDLAFAYRSLGIALANECNDFVEADVAIKAADGFAASDPVKQRIAKDQQTLSGLLERKLDEDRRVETARREEKERTDRLTLQLKLKSWFRERTLEIMPARFHWGEESMLAEEIQAIRFGITITRTNGIKTGVNALLAVRGRSSRTILCDWLGEFDFSRAVQSVMGLYSTSILTAILTAIERGQGLSIGQIQIQKQGIAFETGVFRAKRQLVPWSAAATVTSAGQIHISSRQDAKTRKAISCRDDWNACLLPTLVEILKRSD